MPDSLCFDWISSYPVHTWIPGATGSLGVGGVIVFCLYLFNAGITLFWIHLQKARASYGTEHAAKYVIFPVYIPFMWGSALSDALLALLFAAAFITTKVQIIVEEPNNVGASFAAGMVYAVEHFVIEGVAFLLMQYGCGIQSRYRAAQGAFAWALVTFIAQMVVYRNGDKKWLVEVIDDAWCLIQIFFYLACWLLPKRLLFRRPALIPYARFWACYRSIDFISTNMVLHSSGTPMWWQDTGGCLYIVGSIYLFALTKPYVIYWTLLADSQWWQGITKLNAAAGFNSSDGNDDQDDKKTIDYYVTTNTYRNRNLSCDDGRLYSVGSTSSFSSNVFTYKKISSDVPTHYELGNEDDESLDDDSGEECEALLDSRPGEEGADLEENRGDLEENRKPHAHLSTAVGKGRSSRDKEKHTSSSSCGTPTPASTLTGDESAASLLTPLQGMEVGYHEAKDLAQQVSTLHARGDVKLLNFAYITLDKNAPLLGSGSSAKVYRGTYKANPVAIKLLYTPDLNPDIIRRCSSEASILSQIGRAVASKHVVKIYGVSVLPPSVCILLEICDYGSLSDVIRGINFNSTRNHSLFANETTRTSLGSNTSYHSSQDGFDDGSRPPLNLTLSDKYYLALGCARGLAALHHYKNNKYMLCHKDIKSFNFLVDKHLNAKIADFELSSAGGDLVKNRQVRGLGLKPRSWFGKCCSKEQTKTLTTAASTTSLYEDLLQRDSVSASIQNAATAASAISLQMNDQLPVWLAPEVIAASSFGGVDSAASAYTQASDIYSLGLVLWEIMSTKIPYQQEQKVFKQQQRHASRSTLHTAVTVNNSSMPYNELDQFGLNDEFDIGIDADFASDSDFSDSDSEQDFSVVSLGSNELIRTMVLKGVRPTFAVPVDEGEDANSANNTWCNANGYNRLDKEYEELACMCWDKIPDKRPKIEEIVDVLTKCWGKTLHYYIRETEHVIDPSIVTKEYQSRLKVTEKKSFFSSYLLPCRERDTPNPSLPMASTYSGTSTMPLLVSNKRVPQLSNSIGNTTGDSDSGWWGKENSSGSAGIAPALGPMASSLPSNIHATSKAILSDATSHDNPAGGNERSPPEVHSSNHNNASFLSVLLSTMKKESQWLALDICSPPVPTAAGSDPATSSPSSYSSSNGKHGSFLHRSRLPTSGLSNLVGTCSYLVLAATPTTPYLITWSTKGWLLNAPIFNAYTVNELLCSVDLGSLLFDQTPVILGSANAANSVSRNSLLGLDTMPNKPEFSSAPPELQMKMSKNRDILDGCIAKTIKNGEISHCVVECYSRKRVVTTRASISNLNPTTCTLSLHIFPIFEKSSDSCSSAADHNGSLWPYATPSPVDDRASDQSSLKSKKRSNGVSYVVIQFSNITHPYH